MTPAGSPEKVKLGLPEALTVEENVCPAVAVNTALLVKLGRGGSETTMVSVALVVPAALVAESGTV